MRCINPLKASQNQDGDIVYNTRKAVHGLVGFEFECRKCLPCRLNIAREKATRAVHEAKMHENNIFLTLTYNDASLASERLIYEDFQKFMKKLRKTQNGKITYMVTGEYGEKNKRPHWHALLFNYRPKDAKFKYSTDRGDKLFESETISKIWGKGQHDFGEVTMDSAGYVARYAAKKLTHGKDQEHDYHPIHKTSSARGIGKSWIEKYWKHTFENGYVVLPSGDITKIPRFYVDWLKKEKPQEYKKYVSTVREHIIELAEKKNRKEELEYLSEISNYKGGADYPASRSKVKHTILKSKFKKLQETLKL